MSFTATIENNVIKLPPGVDLPDGTEVRIEPVEPESAPTFGESIKGFIGIVRSHSDQASGKTIAERYGDFIGAVKDGPTDLADNHDHYL